MHEHAGRPKLPGEKIVPFKLPDDIRAEYRKEAEAEGVKPTEIYRRALIEYIKSHPGS